MQATLRPYQTEASQAIKAAWKEHRSVIAAIATGGGKTLLAAETTASLNSTGRTLYLANRNELCSQPMEAFRSALGFAPALEKAESKAPLDAQVVIGSIQTLSRQTRLERWPRDHFKYVWCDEAHMAHAASWKRVLEHFNSAKVVGITATPFRADGKDLTEVFQAEAYRKNLFDLVDEGWLVSPDHVDKLSTPISLEQVRVKRNASGEVDYDLNDAANAIEPWFEAIALELKQKHAGRRILAFLPLVASSQKFAAYCNKAGLIAVHVDGNDPDRNQKLQAFKEGRTQVLCNSNLLHTGVDFPCCDATLNLRPTKSKVLYQQIVGRSTRTLPGIIDGINTVQGRLEAIARSAKPRSYIIDPLWLTAEHDLVTPGYLVANSQKEAEDITGMAKGRSSYRLRNIQREREEVIRRRLEATARFREGLTWEFFAASIGDHTLLNYEPVYAWERQPPTRFSRLLLDKAGVKSESVTTEGLARQVLRAINRRRYHRRAEIPRLAVVAEHQGVTEQLWLLTEKDIQTNKELQLHDKVW